MKKVFVLLLLAVCLLSARTIDRTTVVTIDTRNEREAIRLARSTVVSQIAEENERFVLSHSILRNEELTVRSEIRQVFPIAVTNVRIVEKNRRNFVVAVATSTDTTNFTANVSRMLKNEQMRREAVERERNAVILERNALQNAHSRAAQVERERAERAAQVAERNRQINADTAMRRRASARVVYEFRLEQSFNITADAERILRDPNRRLTTVYIFNERGSRRRVEVRHGRVIRANAVFGVHQPVTQELIDAFAKQLMESRIRDFRRSGAYNNAVNRLTIEMRDEMTGANFNAQTAIRETTLQRTNIPLAPQVAPQRNRREFNAFRFWAWTSFAAGVGMFIPAMIAENNIESHRFTAVLQVPAFFAFCGALALGGITIIERLLD